MSTAQILATFSEHKAMLDETFNKLKRKINVQGNDGIDHYTVIALVDDKVQLEMMNHLAEEYEPAEHDGQRGGVSSVC